MTMKLIFAIVLCTNFFVSISTNQYRDANIDLPGPDLSNKNNKEKILIKRSITDYNNKIRADELVTEFENAKRFCENLQQISQELSPIFKINNELIFRTQLNELRNNIESMKEFQVLCSQFKLNAKINPPSKRLSFSSFQNSGSSSKESETNDVSHKKKDFFFDNESFRFNINLKDASSVRSLLNNYLIEVLAKYSEPDRLIQPIRQNEIHSNSNGKTKFKKSDRSVVTRRSNQRAPDIASLEPTFEFSWLKHNPLEQPEGIRYKKKNPFDKEGIRFKRSMFTYLRYPFVREGIRFKKAPFESEGIRFKKEPFVNEGIRFKKVPFESEGIRFKKSSEEERNKKAPFEEEGIRYKKSPFDEEGIRFKKSAFGTEGVQLKKPKSDSDESLLNKRIPFDTEGIRY